ncbi:polysaccharide deacetylase family protein [Mesobacillus foraminis]|uniref:Putative sporulation protein (Polysaccharide deacetylase family) n=1 Tax=Mesobacillus foraminis TaxID=279826 RepID=A0A4V2RDP4_9BACI|nr:polysaccharide deacetylase family protein [Mesobacillus foraminis]TCN25570.1 putative sporulation protein (polysaccharide deacetylase family) [Mesobacillus foraminis]
MKKLFGAAVMLAGAWLLVSNPFSHQYITYLKSESVPVSMHKDSLYRELETKAPDYEIKPVDARIDSVWKAIPGYNGLKVNIGKSYDKMKREGRFEADLLVFEEIKPQVHLSDLPASPIYRGNPEKPMVSFIINVAWGNEYLSDMLATLKKHHVYATFFLEGRWAKNNPELVKMIVDAGHEVGNHSFSHPDMRSLQAAAIHDEIKKTNDVIEATTGRKARWFGPPSGSFKEEVVKIAAVHQLGTVLWSIDTIDWKKPTPDELNQRVLGKLHNGAMILMHPTDSTEKALETMVLGIKEKHLEIGTVSEMLSEKRILHKKAK